MLGRIIGDGAVSMTASIGSGMLGTVVGGPILGMASAMTAWGIIEGASAYSTVKEYGNLSYEDQAKVSSLVGMAAGLISALPAFNIIGKMGLQKPFQQDMARRIIKRGLYKNIGVNALKQGIAEATEESLQEAVHIVAETSYMEDADDQPGKKDYRELSLQLMQDFY